MDEADDEFCITSEQAYVAVTTIACSQCRAPIEAICIYCESGVVSDEPLEQFTVSEIWAVDEALARQLEAWPSFRYVEAEGYFANHCPHCNVLQEDMYLHSEPDQPFFALTRAPEGAIKLTALAGRIQLSGNESFEI